MLVNTYKTFTYKCPSCGAFEFTNISIFNLYNLDEYVITCRCGENIGAIRPNKKHGFSIHINCIGCGHEHIYNVSIASLVNNQMIEHKCPKTGIYLGFFGNDNDVRERIDRLEEELDSLISMFGYDDYFKNTQVMLQTLNKIHDLAESGNLFCECGSSDVDLILLSDMIQLRCRKCPGVRNIYAGNNKDLKATLKARNIFLSIDL